MYYYIKGILVHLENDFAAIEAAGVAYKLIISKTTYSELTASLDSEVLLYTYLNVKEDIMDLYGFASEEELEMYKLLITVSGIGPKGALSILSCLPPSLLADAVKNNDARAISSAQGIGLKSAQKVILELKDKIFKMSIPQGETKMPRSSGSVSDAVDALIVLGYTRSQAQGVLKEISAETTEEMIRIALKKLANK